MNRQILLASHPLGMPELSHFKMEKSPIPQTSKGEIIVQSLYLSVDPYMRGRLGGRPSSHPPILVNQCIRGDGLGIVRETKSDRFKLGQVVTGYLEWADYSLLNEKEAQVVELGAIPLTAALGPLGMTGMTAYFGFLEISQAKIGETVVISGAAGAVGTIVGQIAKIKGCRVVGIAGSEAKIEYLKRELGFDAAIHYKSAGFSEHLAASCPKGVDIYFDNVGGEISDSAIKLINKFGRIILCGQISTYNQQQPDVGLRHFRTLIVKSALAKGFIVWDYKDRFPEGIRQMTQWIQEGMIKWKETVLEGLENTPRAFLGLFSGDNIGKQLVKVSDPHQSGWTKPL